MGLDPTPFVKPSIQLVTSAARTGLAKSKKYFSPTIVIAGQNSAGKTSLVERLVNGTLSQRQRKDETQGFKSILTDLTFQVEGAQTKTGSFWIRDSRGFFDSGPLTEDIKRKAPRFIFFVFDVRRIILSEINADPVQKYFDVFEWMQKFKARAEEHIEQNAKAKRKLCGIAVLINKCDQLSPDEFQEKKKIVEETIKPIFSTLQSRIGAGEHNFGVFYTTLINNTLIARKENTSSDLPLALEHMYQCLSRCGVI